MAGGSQDRLATLDLLRFAAALAVLAFHYLFRGAAADGYLAAGYPEAAPYAIYGYFGLNLFFMISGFVIAWSAEGRGAITFAVARFTRLYPGFVACMSATFAVMLYAGMAPFSASWDQYYANLTMFAPALGHPFMDGVYWTIVLEIIFYGWVAMALLTGAFQRWKLGLIFVWLAVAMANEHWLMNGTVRTVFVTEFAPYFAIGILMHHLGAHGRSAETLLLLLTTLVMSFPAGVPARDWMLGHYGVALDDQALAITNAAVIALFLLAVMARRLVPATPFVLLLGGLTYPLYLLHQNIGYITLNILATEVGRWHAVIAVTGIMLLASALVWLVFERPAQYAIKRLLNPAASAIDALLAPKLRPAGPPAAASAAPMPFGKRAIRPQSPMKKGA